jgi:hypothetical protein
MAYDNEWPQVLPCEGESLVEWMRRVEADYPGMSSDIPF